MSTTFEWSFDSFEVAPDYEGLPNALRVVHWRLTASAPGKLTSAKAGVAQLGTPNAEEFTTYSQITKEQLIEWVESSFEDIEAFKEEFAAELQPIPSVVQMAAPWEQTDE